MKIIAVVYGLFAQIMPEISPFVVIFDKKQQNKDDVPRIKNITMCENCACIIWGFCSIFV